MRRYFPIFDWGRSYTRANLSSDLLAAVIVTIMLIPQSLAYAMLAGLPPEIGLFASILPLMIYAVFGTSGSLAVGPVAVVSLMTAASVSQIAPTGSEAYLAGAIALAFLSGLFLLVMGLLRLGFIANFLSHPVISGFITASGLIIAAGQLPHLLGISVEGQSLFALAAGIYNQIGQINVATVMIAVPTLALLLWARQGMRGQLQGLGLSKTTATIIARATPVIAVFATAYVTWALQLRVAIVGDIPSGLPSLALPQFDLALWSQIALPALMISIVGYVESVSIAQTLAAKRRQRIDPNQELIALGGANLGSALSGGFPVTGGFARSVVNADAGAETPAAGAFTAIGMGVATLILTPALFYLPKATLAATIILAVLSLVDFAAMRRVWAYDRADFAAMAATVLVTLGVGIEAGITAGVILSLVLHLWRSSRPHVAIVGQVPGTEHFRNVERHSVVTCPDILSIRVDESLYFPNVRFLEDRIMGAVACNPLLRHVILMFPAVNLVDASALEALESIMARLRDAGVNLHLSEVKGPVMDRLRRSHFLRDLTGSVHLTQYDAMQALAPDVTYATRCAARCETLKSA